MKHLLALDQGTSSSRALVFDEDGRIVAQAQREFPQIYPRPGWVEHDPDDLWTSQLETAREALAIARLDARDVAGLGITNQRETTLIWNRETGLPIANAIVWQDRRTEAACRKLAADGLAARVRDVTGLVIDPYFSATKIAWLLDHVAGAREAATRGELAFGTVDTWLVWKLTSGRLHVTDVSNASRTMLFDIRKGEWDEDLLTALRIPRALLPDVHASAYRFGETDAAVFGASIPIAALAGDQQAALFGQACFRPGLAKNTYGTGCFLLTPLGERFALSSNGLVTTRTAQVAHLGDSRPGFALEGSVFIGGAVVQWLRDGLRAIGSSAEIERVAESVPDAGGVAFVPAFAGLGAPYWKPAATGTIVGLTRGSTVAHIARAALESIAFQSAALLDAMTRDAEGGPRIDELRVDGGASVNNLLMQFQADLLGIPVVRPAVTETTALGVAYLAGLAVGLYPSVDAIAQRWRAERRFLPTMSRERARTLVERWEHAVRQAVCE